MSMNRNTSMESIVAQIQGFPSSATDIAHFHNFLRRSEFLLQSESSTRLLPLLSQLDPSIHSLGYLYILEACTSAPITKEQANEFVIPVSRFLNTCDAEQIRLEPDKFIAICRRLKDLVILLESPIRGISPVCSAIRKLQSSSESLTTLHADFLILCLSAKCYKTGLSILDGDIYEVDQPKDLFLYCYYGGMICIGQKCFRKALELLHNIVTAPMSTVSAIAVEAYKKYILVSLIHLGQFSSSFPRYTSSVAQRNLKSHTKPYLNLANAYGTGKVLEVETCIQEHREKFEMDSNLGLVKQVVSSMYKRNIQRLTQTYLTLSLQDIANTVQLNSARDAEMHVLQMIQDGEIYATINQKDGMVRFLENPEQYKTFEMIEGIDSSIQRIMTLSKKLTAMDELMSYDPLYLSRAAQEQQRLEFDEYDSSFKIQHLNSDKLGGSFLC